MTNELANGLRDLADWLDASAEVVPEHVVDHTFNVCCLRREQIEAVARSGGRWEKVDDGNYFTLRRTFGPVTLDFFTARENVCRRVVVDTIEHPEKVVPAHVEEVVEWVWDEPILGGAAA